MNRTPTAQVGNLHVFKTGDDRYVLKTLTGELLGMYPTARMATDAAVARITASYRAGKR